MFSATYSIEVQKIAKTFLGPNAFYVQIGIMNSAVQNVEQKFFMVRFWANRFLVKSYIIFVRNGTCYD